MAKPKFQSVRGMRDLLPPESGRFDAVVTTFTNLASQAGYGRVDTPLLESTELFSRSVGEGTDIVDKEMYTFTDRSENSLTLRPELTAGVVRAYIEHGLASQPRPVRLFYIGPCFRYERPQAGRYRQFNQIGVEVFGDADPVVDAQVILLGRRFYRTAGLGEVTVQINSLGDDVCRPKYRQALADYLEDNLKKLAEIDRERLKVNPLRVLDSKEPATIKLVADAPQLLNYLCDDCQAHLTGVLEYLDAVGARYEVNPHLVRGFDYYTRTVFEFYGQREGSQNAVGAGGRYDHLVEELGGTATPAIGFGIGVERVLLELEENKTQVPEAVFNGVYVASLGDPARLTAFELTAQLLDIGVSAVGSVAHDGIGAQLGRADKLGAKFAVIIGQREVMEKTVLVRDMVSGAQETLQFSKVVRELAKRFGVVA